MPRFRVQLKQGSRTIINRIEAKNQAAVLDFFNSLTSMKVSEIIGESGGYYKDDTLPPSDDFNYFPFAKFYVRNESSSKSYQVVLHNMKISKNMDDVALKAKEFLEIQSLNVDSIYSFILKNRKI